MKKRTYTKTIQRLAQLLFLPPLLSSSFLLLAYTKTTHQQARKKMPERKKILGLIHRYTA